MNDEIWRAIVECDPTYDGQVYYGLLTTGIFCRPSCKSKTPKRENVNIFYSVKEAKDAGLRPCKRCRPEEKESLSHEQELANKLAHYISEFYYEPQTLQKMAAKLFVSPFYLQKTFTRTMNLSPAKYVTKKRMEAAKRLLLETNGSITDIAVQTGFRTSAHFSDLFRKETGLSPKEYRNRSAAHLKEGAAHQ